MAPYRFASFAALAARPAIDLLVIYARRGGQPYDWEADERAARFDRVVLGPRRTDRSPRKGFTRTLRGFRPDLTIVGGWDQPGYHLVTAARPALGRRVVVWSESTGTDRRRSTAFKNALKRWILERADGVLVPGMRARQYCESLGARVRRVFVAPNAVDNERFATGALQARARRAATADASPMLLYVGRLDPEKGVDVLLRAWASVERSSPGDLLIVGTGTLDAPLRRQAADLGLTRVTFQGFVPQADLPGCYGRADVFVFPSSSDPWGMVINEAMASGLPIVTTSAPGGVDELVVDGENGLVAAPGDPAGLAEAIRKLVHDPSLRRLMGEASTRIVTRFTPERWASAIVEMAGELH
jgi:glycosyltransferase involved in cell wall biosynthesis